jgi:dinuclear metal center YbgI/SA1388 family protein
VRERVGAAASGLSRSVKVAAQAREDVAQSAARASEPVSSVQRLLEERYPPAWAEDWDRVGLVLGEPTATVTRILFAVDCVPATVDEAERVGAQMMVVHHPLLLRGVSSVAPTTYRGRIVHRLIRAGIALYTAHTNADVAAPGVSDALAARLGLLDLEPLRAATSAATGAVTSAVTGAAAQDAGTTGRGTGRVGRLPAPLSLAALTDLAARNLPPTAWGVRAAGDPDRVVRRVAVCGGSGDSFLADAVRCGADAYLTADLRHHPATDHLADGGPALIDAAHWATERPWLDDVAAYLRDATGVETIVSDLDTDPWTLHAPSQSAQRT